MRRCLRRLIGRAPEVVIALLGFLVEGVWEVARFPLYEFPAEPELPTKAWYILHCTLGDVVILLACFYLTALLRKSRGWCLRARPADVCVFTACGLLYTIWSEGVNVYARGSWGYKQWMPTLLGIGLAPLLQWMLLPPLLTLLAGKVLAAWSDSSHVKG